ncbi:MAG: FtsQ-type POTRA domain-containing protein, partial [Streptococcus salivarius]|nr:FtsQ-type POTRA domain-containing protein [Streptococcus salivarius]
MAKKDQESQEKQVLTEWQKRNLEFLRKKETEDSEEFANGKVVHSEEATSNENQPPVKKKVRKKKKTKRKKRKKGNTASNIPIAQQNLAGLVIFIAALLIVFSLFFISPWSKQKVLTVSGTKNALPEDVKVASGILDTDYITHVFFNQGKIASTVEKTNVWVKKATVTYSFPNQFNIAVKEYPIVAYRQTTNGYVSILQSGKTGGTVSTSNLPDKFITLKMDDEKKIEELVKELNKLDTKIKNNIQIINLTPTKATSDLLTIELYDGNSIRVPLSQLTVKLPYYEKIKSQLSDGSIVDMEVGLYTTTPEVESSKTDGDKKKDKDKTDKKEEKELEVSIGRCGIKEATPEILTAVEEGKEIANGIIVARDLVNEPSNVIYPETLANKAVEVGAESGFEVEVHGVEKIKELNMEAFYNVAKGSTKEPKLIVMRYFGDKDNKDKVLGLVGKGLTYDSGGYSIKPTDSMLDM